jgi:small subunit ribosomal protein S17
MESNRKTRIGRVLISKMDKTVVVMVETRRPHPRYKKVIRHRTKFKAHDEGNVCGAGDVVRIVETRPLSKEKRWRVAEVVTKAETVEVRPEEIE